MSSAKKGGLGKGLDAIFMDNNADGGAVLLRISEIEPDRRQPRKNFDADSLNELAQSISEHGVLQPLLVRPIPAGGYQLVAGERRWRAARMAGLDEVPAVIRELTDREAAELSLIENLQRKDLNPIEEAKGYQRLVDEYAMTQEDVAKVIGKSRPAVANSLRLLDLPGQILEWIDEGKLSAGHGRALLAIGDTDKLLVAASMTLEKSLTVRDVEKLARAEWRPRRGTHASKESTAYKEWELALTQQLGRRVSIYSKGKTNTLLVEFFDEEDLSRLAKRLCQNQ